ncbi:MAG: hypothetical protein ABJC13_10880 [Acidobacteriota bacterium]
MEDLKSKPLGSVSNDDLIETRRTLHWAMAAASAPGKQLIPARPDAAEQSLVWDSGRSAFLQGQIAGIHETFRSALVVDPPALALFDKAGDEIASHPLAGQTLDEVYAWLTVEVETRIEHPLGKPLERPLPNQPEETEMPDAGVAHGAPFQFNLGGPAELARWFAFGAGRFEEILANDPQAGEILLWPHHFDLATLITLAGEGENASTVGVGLSPGDSTRPLPYFYVNAWPTPKEPALPALPSGGVWNTEGWFGAVLEGAPLLALGTAEEQAAAARDFLAVALEACRRFVREAS